MRLHRPTVEELREVVNYDPETGALTWRITRDNHSATAGEPVSIARNGMKCTVLNWKWRAPTLVWMLHYGQPPRQIVPLDGDETNLKISNWVPRTIAKAVAWRERARSC